MGGKINLEYFVDLISGWLQRNEVGLLSKIRETGKWDKDLSSNLEKSFANAFVANHFLMGPEGEPVAFDGQKYIRVSKENCRQIISDVSSVLVFNGRYLTDTARRAYDTVSDKLENCPFTPQRNFVTLNNCVLDTEHMEVMDFSPNIYACTCIDIDYDPDRKSALWQKFLNDVLPDPDLQKTLQEFIGCAFINRKKIKMESMCYLLGGGSNGKSVLFSAILETLGRDNVSSLEIMDLVSDKSTSAYNIAMITGKLLNFSSEMSSKDISGGKYKSLISGEPMAARHPYGRTFITDLIPPFIANLNKMPSVSDQTYGHFRRSIVIPFTRTFREEEQDRQLPFKLLGERVAIFNWIVEGTKRFYAQNGTFTKSAAIGAITEKSRTESNSVLSFLYDRGYNKEGDIEEPAVTDRDLYTQYTTYCVDCGFKPYSKRKMVDMLRGEGFSVSSGWDINRNRVFQIILRRKYSEQDQILQEAENITALPF